MALETERSDQNLTYIQEGHGKGGSMSLLIYGVFMLQGTNGYSATGLTTSND